LSVRVRSPAPKEEKMDKSKIRECLDILGLALADEGHVWTSKERKAYEEGIELCKE